MRFLLSLSAYQVTSYLHYYYYNKVGPGQIDISALHRVHDIIFIEVCT